MAIHANNLLSTYRFQFHQQFSFKQLNDTINYLQKLGVKMVYASPIFKAVPGSMHGYDSVNPLEINPEIGSLEEFREINNELRKKGIGWLQDIVPNHMAFHHDNKWLMDVLEKGPQSVYADFFDIDWQNKELNGKLMAPFLGSELEKAMQKGEIKIAYEQNRLLLKYFDSFYPTNINSYYTILFADQKIASLSELAKELAQITKAEDVERYHHQWEEWLSRLAALSRQSQVANHIKNRLEKFNSNTNCLRRLVDQQFYKLCHWQTTDSKINYRRFFTVNGLICLNIQNRNVFDAYHKLIGIMLKEGLIQGLRVDHIDGLYDPDFYLRSLNQLAGPQTYVTVEKILEANEQLPGEWATQGTTGYDFLALVNNLFTNKNAEGEFNAFYEDCVGDGSSAWEQLLDNKALILTKHLGGELNNLYELLVKTIDKKTLSAVYPDDLKTAISEFLISCPVYRYYASTFPLSDQEAMAIDRVFTNVRQQGKADGNAIDLLRSTMLELPQHATDEQKNRLLHFFRRCMQLSGPLMAKGLEDTFMYTYSRFIGHNDVGDSPLAFGITKDEFHKAMIERQRKWPLTLNATSTHDTKRGEDVRARLNVLTDLPAEWFSHVSEWKELNSPFKDSDIPNPNEEYFIYQNLVGAYPMSDPDKRNFLPRFHQYLEKALREAKINSNWTEPDIDYERAIKEFVTKILANDSEFSRSLTSFVEKINDFGIANSLAQLLLKFTCPGIPDVYQGCELWDFSFVDPDNRRPVDFALRSEILDSFEQEENVERLLKSLWNQRSNGYIKLWLTHSLLKLRKQSNDFFVNADYLPLNVSGEYADYVFAFARQYGRQCLVIAVPLHLAALCQEQKVTDILSLDWKNTQVILPRRLAHNASDFLLAEKLVFQSKVAVDKLFKHIPVAMLQFEAEENERSAGILLHLTCLPSKFGIGDMGPEAFAFADMLQRCNQKIWQILPLTPVDAAQSFSPYSSFSGMAGNIFLISPEQLVKDGLLSADEISSFCIAETDRINFNQVIEDKNAIFERLWMNVNKAKGSEVWNQFLSFCAEEAAWLDDFALYSVIKIKQQQKPWYEWPEEFKKKNTGALLGIAEADKDNVEKTKFLQFIFQKQWRQLRKYCNDKGIKIFGDLSFYVSYDSADVWSQPENFAIDEHANLIAVAGTPPDAFSSDGQYWGMPVFNWERLRETNYKWWLNRIKRNKLFFDLVRLDHFRAFAAYWEIPAEAGTARLGKWREGPGSDFFKALKEELGELPFVAEDLGDIDDAVIDLRKQFDLPGMRVLQFAFDENMPVSDYVPHNYDINSIVYTGTHDNNTTRGWYMRIKEDSVKDRINQYLGKSVDESNVNDEFIRLAYGSVAKTAIIPMQDVLNLDETARMNVPSATNNDNWSWRLLPDQVNAAEDKLRQLTWLFNRK